MKKGVIALPDLENVQHDLLLIIATSLAILFATGLAGSPSRAGVPVIFP
ncbi:conserved hypothetical protein [anaerobic digester metagenome]|jgi:hypothetical protein|uniref:Uncharacterized protein n=1 Tax=anaerobic digester metagenome TaxID=1263854 RepID=A0A485LU52_9ZZZZ